MRQVLDRLILSSQKKGYYDTLRPAMLYALLLAMLAGCSSASSGSRYDPDCKYSLKKRKTHISRIVPGSPDPVTEELPVKVSGHEILQLFSSIRERFGTVYRWGGRSLDGFDCSGFVQYLYEETFQLLMPRTSADMASLGKVVPRNRLRPGDLVFFSNRGKTIDHVGIYMGDNSFAHVSTSRGVRIDRLDSLYYDQRYVCAARIIRPD
ncbi:MAG: C40 family peptidase [Chlorobium sp.]|jgi:lipoprotein Spr|uniref:C40 family peptidase n=1 Tax=Chlorobium sp. TaxID=1095 RepID=UPI001D331657|nr:C40 family peptidase [Chlorobium sp.]MBN1278526.1 C40 family peptidase [Chlorobiaceae bacterium]MCF8215568.1 C40 family peptidase [Chlorobium sp.]MCF8270378.1 C40 family peptidase [Chlorobium sp.]MCF8286747.1 C40 family peptidase [Chlorobium sp.]MCF8290269.1 C40 family peptidase [Chlorobium sp.]